MPHTANLRSETSESRVAAAPRTRVAQRAETRSLVEAGCEETLPHVGVQARGLDDHPHRARLRADEVREGEMAPGLAAAEDVSGSPCPLGAEVDPESGGGGRGGGALAQGPVPGVGGQTPLWALWPGDGAHLALGRGLERVLRPRGEAPEVRA